MYVSGTKYGEHAKGLKTFNLGRREEKWFLK
jgi:hypothetical protein